MKLRVLFSMIIILSNTLVNANEMNEDEVITLENCQQPIQPISTVSFTVTSNAVIEKHSYKNGKPLTLKHSIERSHVTDETYYLFTPWSETEVGTKKALTIKYNGKSIEKYSVELIGEYVESALLVNAKNEFYVCRDKE
ncbi:hypothetical protein P3485_09900 [Vibrio parahaemolyticus]|uniref:hypothetical protein n=1 Tax=Vibrio parahaemolyticus TaxID=670 RepID=UPI001E07F4DD|nr:hypothetical protein [Vibrio parahaemolyticus]EJB0371193.1 hypothetical protein [Vibrio parahaemolyticus]EJE8516619.1 hypothetical protein [Vibrio parahaemolyticus]EJE8775366.1 hypothetical protein [Vibrio parahaemolyticus]EJG2373233.1 hypothetical protein [Vibrio parahaemolyticus]MDF4514947.1 hypothetical protein [Vibrio parahaemolyticus]